jgi:toxin ParE1/3/4
MAIGPRPVDWTPTAREALDEIVAYIAEDSPAAALKVLEVVLDAAESLAVFAHRGRVVPELQEDRVREIFIYSYRLMYEILPSQVRILTVIHGARDFASWLERRERPDEDR